MFSHCWQGSLLWLGLATAVVAADAAADVSQALALIERAEVDLKTCRIRFAHSYSRTSGKHFDQCDNSYVEVGAGDRRRQDESFFQSSDKSAVKIPQLRVFDGKRHCIFNPHLKTGSVGTQGKLSGTYSSALYGVEGGFWGVLKPYRDRIRGEWATINGQRLLQIRWTSRGEVEETATLDPALDFQPRTWVTVLRNKPPYYRGNMGTTGSKQFKDYVQSSGI